MQTVGNLPSVCKNPAMPSALPPAAGEPPRALLVALRRVLRPLVRLLLANGITQPALARVLKSLYVEVAERDFSLPGERASDSRVSLLTGVHRKDVRALRAAPPATDEVPESVSIGSQIVTRWCSDPRFLRDGHPATLPRRGPDSFEALVESVARKDLKARVVLDELARLGVVHLTQEDTVVLELEAFVPRHGFDEKAYYLGRNVGDHLEVAVRNLEDAEAPGLERAVSSGGLTAREVARLHALCRDLAMQALRDVNRRAAAARRRGDARAGATHRITFGTYFHSEDTAETAATGANADADPEPPQ